MFQCYADGLGQTTTTKPDGFFASKFFVHFVGFSELQLDVNQSEEIDKRIVFITVFSSSYVHAPDAYKLNDAR